MKKLLGLSLVLLWVTVGCNLLGDDEEGTGKLVVPFELGNGRECSELGVVEVRAELDDGEIAETVDCDAGEVRFSDVKPGAYEVVLYGLDEDGVAILDSLADPPYEVEIEEGKTVVLDPEAALTLAPAKVLVRWNFGFGSCESASITDFEVSAWTDDAERLLQTRVTCGTSGEGRDQYRTVPDDERELKGDEVSEIELQPVDRDGEAVGAATVFTFDPPGPGREIKLSLTCDETGCDGSGMPD